MLLRALPPTAPTCLILSVAVSALLTINFWFQGSIGRVGSSYSASVLLANETIGLYLNRTDAGETPRWAGGLWRAPRGPSPSNWSWITLGFGYAIGGTSGGHAVRLVIVPDWFIFAVFSLCPVLKWNRRRRLQNQIAGRCRRCGYDLRATRERCPECGLVVS